MGPQIYPVDQQLHDPRLFGQAEFDPQRIELQQCLPRLVLVDGILLGPRRAPCADDDLRLAASMSAAGTRPPRGRSAPASAAKRAIGASPVVPCTRWSAISRVQCSRCATNAPQLGKRRPAIALRFT
jgi:hypothetical protein